MRWTIEGPDSSYSCFEIHICWKVESDKRIEPPIHTEYLRSGGAMILTFIEAGASAVSSLESHLIYRQFFPRGGGCCCCLRVDFSTSAV